MSSERKLSANRANARQSTGPRSVAGKRRSARNAEKHGLSVPVLQDAELAKDVEGLALKIALGRRDQPFEMAVAIAEAEIDLIRIRRLRSDLINRALREGPRTSVKDQLEHIRIGARLIDGREGRGPLLAADEQYWDNFLRRRAPSAAELHAGALADLTRELAKLDRYERRARSRRKIAIRRFTAS